MHLNQILMAATEEETMTEVLFSDLPTLLLLTAIGVVAAGVILHLIYKYIVYGKNRKK